MKFVNKVLCWPLIGDREERINLPYPRAWRAPSIVFGTNMRLRQYKFTPDLSRCFLLINYPWFSDCEKQIRWFCLRTANVLTNAKSTKYFVHTNLLSTPQNQQFIAHTMLSITSNFNWKPKTDYFINTLCWIEQPPWMGKFSAKYD